MNASRFVALVPDFDPELLVVVTDPHDWQNWLVRYQGRTLTSGTLFYCAQWMAHALRGESY